MKNSSPLFAARGARRAAALLVSLVLGAGAARAARAADFVVSNLGDSGAGSLREAMTLANAAAGDDSITFDASVAGTIALTTSLPTVLGPGKGGPNGLSIFGPGASAVAIAGVGSKGGFRLMQVAVGATLNLSVLTLQNGAATGDGGAILNGGSLSISNCVLENNTASGGGGAIANSQNATLRIQNSTFSGNSAAHGGAVAIAAGAAALTVLENVTFSGNTALGVGGAAEVRSPTNFDSCTFTLNRADTANNGGGSGGGFFLATQGTTGSVLRNSIVSGNTAGNPSRGDDDVNAVPVGSTFNFIGPGAMLAPLDFNDDSGVPTHAIVTKSPAFDAGSTNLENDARGFRRGIGRGDDIGAFELQVRLSLTVTTLVDEDNGSIDPRAGQGVGTSLREAINEANRILDGEIFFAAPVRGEIRLNTALPTFSNLTRVSGPGAGLLAIKGASVSGGPALFEVASGNNSEVRMSDLTLRDGVAPLLNDARTGGVAGPNGAINVRGGLSLERCVVSGNAGRAIFVAGDGGMDLSECTLSGNGAKGATGGAVLNQGAMTASKCTFSGNNGATGGAIDNGGQMSLSNSTLAGNTAGERGGAISNRGFLDLIFVSLGFNTAGNGGAAVSSSGTLTLRSTLASQNTGGNFVGVVASQGFNLSDDTLGAVGGAGDRRGVGAKLLLLAGNGGPTATLALAPDSPAIDSGGPEEGSFATDQRGVLRPQGAGVDIGAFEFGDPLGAASLVVTTTADSVAGDGLISLREAIGNANADPDASVITFAVSGTLTVTSSLPSVESDVSISGPTAAGAGVTILSATPATIFPVGSGNVTFGNLTVTSIYAGIFVRGGTVLVQNCTLTGVTENNNSGSIGILVQFLGSAVTARNCTIAGQTNYGILGLKSTTTTVENCTLTGNSTGIGVDFDPTLGGTRPVLNLKNSLVVGNSNGNVSGTITSGSNNITSGSAAVSGLDPAGLNLNGGPTQTIAIVNAAGTAVNTGRNASATGLTTDQRGTGFARIQAGIVDIGAFELSDPTGAAGLVVTTNADVSAVDGSISLREAITNANASADSSTVTFASNVRGSIDLASTLPLFTTPVTVTGPGANLLAVNRPSGAAPFRLFTVTNFSSRIQNLMLSGGLATGSGDGGLDGTGGAVLVKSGTTLSLNAVHVKGNSALGGGGVENFGTLVVGDSTFSDNSATVGTGGAIHSTPTATSFTVNNSTFFGNRSADSGGAIQADTSATLNSLTVTNNLADSDQNGSGAGGLSLSGGSLTNSLVVGNIARTAVSNVFGNPGTIQANRTAGTPAEAGLETDANGAPVLKNNGGPTPTVALLPGGLVVNAGSTSLFFDQRGISRPQGAQDDIGAFELVDVVAPTVVSIVRLDPNPTGADSVVFQVRFSESVTGVQAADFSIATTGSIRGASILSVAASGALANVTVGNISGFGTLRLDVLTSATINDLSGNALVGGFSGGEVYTRNDTKVTPPTPATSGALISEFRHRGPGGSGDEYVEIYNTTGAPLEIGKWSVQTSAGSTVVPDNSSIPAFGHYLLTGGAYSLGAYGAGDALLSGDASDASGVALVNAAGATQDAAGFAASPANLREGGGLPSSPTVNGQFAWMRDFVGASPKDSGNSVDDFVFLVTNGANVAGTSGPVTAQLGAPSPEGLASPTNLNSLLFAGLLDPLTSQNSAPNRIRTGSGNAGNLLIRRTLKNNSSRAISKLRMQVTFITGLGGPGSAGSAAPVPGQADVRLIGKGTETVRVQGNDLTVYGTLLEAPSSTTTTSGVAPETSVTGGGGGLGSSLSFDLLLATPLQPGQTRAYAFNLQVAKSGAFIVAFNILANTTAPSP